MISIGYIDMKFDNRVVSGESIQKAWNFLVFQHLEYSGTAAGFCLLKDSR